MGRRFRIQRRRWGTRLHRWLKSLGTGTKYRLLFAADSAALILSVALAARMTLPAAPEAARAVPVDLLVIFVALALPALWISGLPRIRLRSYDLRAVLRTARVALIFVASGLVFDRISGAGLPAVTYVLAGLLLFALMVMSRLLMIQALLAIYRRTCATRRVAIYGAGTTGMQLAAALATHESIEAVAFIDDNRALRGLKISGLKVYSPDELPQLVERRRIDRLLLAMPGLSPARLSLKLMRLQALGVDVHAVPSFTRLAGEAEILSHIRPVSLDDLLGRRPLSDAIPDASEAFCGKSVLVTGAGGSIGSELCRQLLACGVRRLVMLELSEPALYQIDRELRGLPEQTAELVPVLGSVLDPRLLRQLMAAHEVEAVLHAAAYKHVPLVEANPLAGLRNNVIGTRQVAEAAREAGVAHFLLVSTDKAVRPSGIMGASKRLAELVVQDLASRPSRTKFAIVRFGNVLGSSGSVIPLFEEQIARGGPVTLTHEEVTRYFMTIPEAAGLVLASVNFSQGGEVFVLDMGDPVPIRRLAGQMILNAGLTIRSDDNPEGDILIEVTGLRPGEKLHEELLIGAGRVTTPHPKILRVEEEHLSELEVATMLRELTGAIDQADPSAAVQAARRWVGRDAPASAAAPLRSRPATG